jgi:hypothetical protein
MQQTYLAKFACTLHATLLRLALTVRSSHGSLQLLSSTCWEGKDPIYAQARAPHQLTHLLVATAAEAAAEAVEAMRGVRGCLRAAAATRGGLAGALAGFGSRARAVERGVGRGAARGQA